MPFLTRLLEGDRPTLRLLRREPVRERPAARTCGRGCSAIEYTTRAERRETGAWWRRTLVGVLVPPLTLEPPDWSP